jgi:hypothetical protein
VIYIYIYIYMCVCIYYVKVYEHHDLQRVVGHVTCTILAIVCDSYLVQ